jgi:hypothetical protein
MPASTRRCVHGYDQGNAIAAHGGAGARLMRIYDGPSEVHRWSGDRFRWKQRRLVARPRFFSWSRDRTENRYPLFLITLWVVARNILGLKR